MVWLAQIFGPFQNPKSKKPDNPRKKLAVDFFFFCIHWPMPSVLTGHDWSGNFIWDWGVLITPWLPVQVFSKSRYWVNKQLLRCAIAPRNYNWKCPENAKLVFIQLLSEGGEQQCGQNNICPGNDAKGSPGIFTTRAVEVTNILGIFSKTCMMTKVLNISLYILYSCFSYSPKC